MTPRDRNYEAAVAILRTLGERRVELVTTNFVRAETHALLLNRLNYTYALRFLNRLEQGSVPMIRVTPADEQRASLIIRRYTDKNFSFTDATSFSVMDRLHIGAAFAFDENFEQYGLSVLAP
jgi:predicted nucleic acid-binding protein